MAKIKCFRSQSLVSPNSHTEFLEPVTEQKMGTINRTLHGFSRWLSFAFPGKAEEKMPKLSIGSIFFASWWYLKSNESSTFFCCVQCMTTEGHLQKLGHVHRRVCRSIKSFLKERPLSFGCWMPDWKRKSTWNFPSVASFFFFPSVFSLPLLPFPAYPCSGVHHLCLKRICNSSNWVLPISPGSLPEAPAPLLRKGSISDTFVLLLAFHLAGRTVLKNCLFWTSSSFLIYQMSADDGSGGRWARGGASCSLKPFLAQTWS